MNAIDFNSHKNSIIRIFYQEDVVGIGFLVAEKYALTCAHVVGEALLISSSIANRPDGEIQVDFPLANSTEKIKATVVHWYPTSDLNSDIIIEDIAVLKLEHLPSQAQPTKLILAENISKHPFKVFGCPQGVAFGVWATGVLSEQNAKQWVQLEDTKVTGYAIAKGFSGSPVWDEQLQGVVGMVVAADSRREAAKASFMIPNQTLVKSWQYLESVVMGSKPIEKPVKSALSSMRRKYLETQKKDLEEKISEVTTQMSVLDPASMEYKNLKRRNNLYFSELDTIEEQLTGY
ncbi:trypsin-like peptidase domain-containing protein [Nodularia spumigena CS-591/12]|uniref:trypsin-like peptidase domain-containing protein n=1 Tax=Nodularia spumigena TaxID=70799 RepID=UPI00232EEA0F|nr:trypsin-like peptidase domain-containing protein [Nodularia spumigena]MDB9304625.1 trypsin-like peptidase domain-containing protein [Nodularia spumigena CS-591/12]MDB9348295.1 trypsin-like peptidase domain-containing protein [Nodularia spumigena CS-588/01]MDB9354649.1 trypsin-like peptidase domain-containing protein [Nodularia spumigena CS-588/05]